MTHTYIKVVCPNCGRTINKITHISERDAHLAVNQWHSACTDEDVCRQCKLLGDPFVNRRKKISSRYMEV